MQRNILFRGVSFLKKAAFQKKNIFGQPFKNLKYSCYFSSGNDKSKDNDPEVEIVDNDVEDGNTADTAIVLGKNKRYFFFENTYALEVDYPVFPNSQITYTVNEIKYRVFSFFLPIVLVLLDLRNWKT